MWYYLKLISIFLLMFLDQTIPLIILLLLSYFDLTLFLEELIILKRDLVKRTLDPAPIFASLKRVGVQLCREAVVGICTSFEFLIFEVGLYFLKIVSSS